MTTELLDDIHPGEILLEDFMTPLGITARQLAADMVVPPSCISDIVNGARPINRLLEEMTTLMLAEFDAETRFNVRAARGAARGERGLELLQKAQAPQT